MSTEITQKQTFEKKMMEHIRDSIGDLISEEDLKKIIEKGIEKALFEPRKIYGRESYLDRTEDSVVDSAIHKFLSARVTSAVDKWIAENLDRMQLAIDSAVKLGIGSDALVASFL